MFDLIVALILGYASISGLSTALEERKIERRRKYWLKTQAHVTESKVDIKYDEGKKYRAIIEYEFSVDGRHYTSKRVKIGGDMPFTKTSVEALVAAYPIGSSTPVYYDPDQPNLCSLEVTGPINYLVTLIISLMLMALAIQSALRLFKN